MRPIVILLTLAVALGTLSACNSNKSSTGSATATPMEGASSAPTAAASMPDCGAVKPVWVNLKSKKYFGPNSPKYGNTKQGEYLCPDQAKAQGFKPAGKGKHRHKNGQMDVDLNSPQ